MDKPSFDFFSTKKYNTGLESPKADPLFTIHHASPPSSLLSFVSFLPPSPTLTHISSSITPTVSGGVERREREEGEERERAGEEEEGGVGGF